VRRPAALLACLGGLLLGLPVPPAAAADPYAADRVVLVGVPGLTWSDVSAGRTPHVSELAEEGAVGSLSVRAARSTTCLLDGWATLGAGNRAAYPGPEEPVVPAEGAEVSGGPESLCDRQQRIGTAGDVAPEAAVARTAADEGTQRFGARPGALGDAVGCAAVAGRPAALAVARPGVDVDLRDQLPEPDGELAALLGTCPLSVLSLGGLLDTADRGLDEPTPPIADEQVSADRLAGLAEVDAALGRVRSAVAELPGETLLLVAGLSEVDDDRPRLHAVVAAGPGFPPGTWLTSASTGRTPYVQLIDVAPTALRALGLDIPSSMNGRPVVPAGERPALAAAVDHLEQLAVAARAHYRSTGILFWTLVAGVAGVVLAGVAVLGRGAGQRRPGTRGRRALQGGALAVAALPVATYLGNAVPWERAGSPRLVLLAAVLVADALVVLLAAGGPWRRRWSGPPLAVLAVTAATLVLDVLTGSHLEMDGLLGYDAIVAGRFTGYGNLTFGLLSVSVLLLTAAAATAVGRRVPPARRRAAVAGTVAVLGLLTVAVVGAPGLGRDFGGVLAVLPGFALLGMLLTRTRVTVGRAAGVLAAAVVAVGVVSVLDWRRPAGERTHLGRFVEQVLTGEAATVVLRKAQANLDILLGSALVWTLPGALLAAVWLLRPGGLLRGRTTAALRAGLLAVGTSLALGAVVNDSGVAVPATAAALLVPLLVWLAAAPDGRPPEGGDAPRSGPVGDADRVTVVSRGSTVWNA
jgi:hypothetical protein